MAALMTAVAEDGISVVFSSHVVAELEFVVDLRVAADLATECLGLVQGGRRQDGASQFVAAQSVVQVDFVDGRALVRERDGESGVGDFADAITMDSKEARASDLGLLHGAGDENRTRALSLGS